MIVVDASVLAPALVDEGAAGARARERLVGERLAAPELIDLELTSVLRGLTRAKKLTARRARDALDDLIDLLSSVPPTVPCCGAVGSSART